MIHHLIKVLNNLRCGYGVTLPPDPMLNLESGQEPSLVDVETGYHISLESLIKVDSQIIIEPNVQQQSQGKLSGARASISPTKTVWAVIV